MKLYFCRHAQSIGNMTNDYSTTISGKLSETGQTQAKELITRLTALKFDHLFASPIERARHTILPYLQEIRSTAVLWGSLAEGCWQEHTSAEPSGGKRVGDLVTLPANEASFFRNMRDKDVHFMPPDESYAEGLRRIRHSYRVLMRRFGGTNAVILIIGHGHAGSRLLETFLEIEPIGRFDHANTGISKLRETRSDSFKVSYINRY